MIEEKRMGKCTTTERVDLYTRFFVEIWIDFETRWNYYIDARVLIVTRDIKLQAWLIHFGLVINKKKKKRKMKNTFPRFHFFHRFFR